MKAISLAVCGQNRVVSAHKNVVSKGQSIGLAVVNQTPAEWVIDPSCAAFPPMQHDEFIALRASIERNGQHEPILVWGNRIVDGRHRLTILDKKVRGSSIFGGKVAAHSAKPVVVHERLETLYPGVSRIELFSRAQRAGWTTYGNQADDVVVDRKVA